MSTRPLTPRAAVGRTLWWVAVVVIGISTVGPLIWTFATSLKPPAEIISSYLDPIPDHPTLQNYVDLFAQTKFGRYLLNSAILALGGTITNLFFGALAGYAFARLAFRGRQSIFGVFLASMMVPAIVTMVPTFLVLRRFPFAGGNDLFGQGGTGFINSYAAILLPGAVGAFGIFYMRQFFGSLPGEMADAARIDGAGEYRIFSRVYLPLAKGALAVLGVLTFQAGWNAFLWPLIVLNEPDMLTVQVGLASFVNEYQTNYGAQMAGTIVASLPILVVFAFSQRFIVQTNTDSSIK
ncbi:carbohydrate ABC transporter membrane protein 2 (CUT1 family) [Salana multivorans]|uniref:Carbohydrate ABC transporter membrane protein 2 (CUT1 family) n=1 Tax=Salana multivorans TaxID=120377 RepID=A0A3N2DAE1_9MICO|nr:carbohydrate ABC transporter permease [Salana multivorans]MBN8883069.1 carbohydrate ABC transporter permease [Salana multivorans]OJX96887.1 MAG: ABC transporter permease [Micrococcales bacterium 73-15]ROR96703.1 carbohydrate ABC transporter membrane protein 2 (CUT1 family) [Salana multivorans]